MQSQNSGSPGNGSSPRDTLRVPPQSRDAEMGTLGSMCLNREAVGAVLPLIGREESHWFYDPIHRDIFVTLVDLYDTNQPIDLIVVKDELQRRNLLEKIGGEAYLIRLAESVPSWVNAEHYARIVRDKATLRELIRAAGEVIDQAYAENEPTGDIIDHAEQKLFAVTDQRISRPAVQIDEFIDEAMRLLETREGNFLTGVSTGFFRLDELTSGLQPGEMIIVAARPSMGKTAWALNVAEHMAVVNVDPIVFFSMEMSKQQVAQRVLCSRSRVDSHRLRRGELNGGEIEALKTACDELQHKPMLIDDTPGMSILELRSKVRRLKNQYGIRAVFVDYLQLMHAVGLPSREQEVAAISRGLKALARELHVPVIAMAQLNRQPEGREDKRPRMGDLRESGAIEQDADVILMLHREEYYKRDDPEAKGKAEVIIAKQRNGPTGTVTLTFRESQTRFENFSPEHEPGGYVASDAVPF